MVRGVDGYDIVQGQRGREVFLLRAHEEAGESFAALYSVLWDGRLVFLLDPPALFEV